MVDHIHNDKIYSSLFLLKIIMKGFIHSSLSSNCVFQQGGGFHKQQGGGFQLLIQFSQHKQRAQKDKKDDFPIKLIIKLMMASPLLFTKILYKSHG
jgi:hypothetical protein